MSPITRITESRAPRAASLTRRERRLVRRMIDFDPICLQEALYDQRIGRTAKRLLAAYRDELLGQLRTCIEATLCDGHPPGVCDK